MSDFEDARVNVLQGHGTPAQMAQRFGLAADEAAALVDIVPCSHAEQFLSAQVTECRKCGRQFVTTFAKDSPAACRTPALALLIRAAWRHGRLGARALVETHPELSEDDKQRLLDVEPCPHLETYRRECGATYCSLCQVKLSDG